MLSSCSTLKLEEQRALGVAVSSPWILAYRTERSASVLGALSISLGMSCSEISKCVSVYPRLLSLSVEGKLADVLRALAQTAADMYEESTRVGLELQLKDRIANIRQRASISSCENKHRKIPRKCLSATSLGASALGDVDMAKEISEVALKGSVELCKMTEEERRSTTDSVGGVNERVVVFNSGLTADSEGWQDFDLSLDLASSSRDCASKENQEQEHDFMVQIYEELCNDQHAPSDPCVVAAIKDMHERRRGTVRSMLRSLVLRYPLILGTSLTRIKGRLREIKEGNSPPLDELGWPDVVNFIRRAEPAHKRWLAKATVSGQGAVEKKKKYQNDRKKNLRNVKK